MSDEMTAKEYKEYLEKRFEELEDALATGNPSEFFGNYNGMDRVMSRYQYDAKTILDPKFADERSIECVRLMDEAYKLAESRFWDGSYKKDALIFKDPEAFKTTSEWSRYFSSIYMSATRNFRTPVNTFGPIKYKDEIRPLYDKITKNMDKICQIDRRKLIEDRHYNNRGPWGTGGDIERYKEYLKMAMFDAERTFDNGTYNTTVGLEYGPFGYGNTFFADSYFDNILDDAKNAYKTKHPGTLFEYLPVEVAYPLLRETIKQGHEEKWDSKHDEKVQELYRWIDAVYEIAKEQKTKGIYGIYEDPVKAAAKEEGEIMAYLDDIYLRCKAALANESAYDFFGPSKDNGLFHEINDEIGKRVGLHNLYEGDIERKCSLAYQVWQQVCELAKKQHKDGTYGKSEKQKNIKSEGIKMNEIHDLEINQIYNKIKVAENPVNFFGAIEEKEVKKLFRTIMMKYHPDKQSNETMRRYCNTLAEALNPLYTLAQAQFKSGEYLNPPTRVEVTPDNPLKKETVQDLKKMEPILTLKEKGNEYKIHKQVQEGQIADIFVGLKDDSKKIQLKLANDAQYNQYIKGEYDVLRKLDHHSIAKVLTMLKINKENAFIMDDTPGDSIDEIMTKFPNGIPQGHVFWMLERMLENVGYLHHNKIVHGNLQPETLIVNKSNHGVGLTGFEFCIPKANESGAEYKIKNDFYSAPEVGKKTRISPNTDIYSVGKVSTLLLGGDIESGALPNNVDARLRKFINTMTNGNKDMRPDDAWKLWDQLKEIRKEVIGPRTFEEFTY